MKILHIGKYHPPFMGGIENFMAALMTQQVIEGHQVIAIVHHHKKKQPFSKEFDNGVKIHRIPCFGQLAYTPISPTFGHYLNKIIAQEKPDMLHIHMPNFSAFWCLLSSNARKIPWLVHWHSDVLGSVPEYKIKFLYPFYRFFETALLKKSAKIITATPFYAATSEPLQRFYDKVEVIPLGITDIQFKENQNIGDIRQSTLPLNLLMIGRLTYYKGHSLLIDAIAALKNSGTKVNLRIVGGGELAAKLNTQIENLALVDEVQLLGKLPNDLLEKELLSTDLLCLPSIERTEAFGVVLLEAMRCSKPCLVTDVPGSGMSWVVKNGETGFVVKHNNVESLVGTLSDIAKERSILKVLGLNGRKRFDDVFRIEAVSLAISTVYKKLKVSKKNHY